jgi:hypothetical protein
MWRMELIYSDGSVSDEGSAVLKKARVDREDNWNRVSFAVFLAQ